MEFRFRLFNQGIKISLFDRGKEPDQRVLIRIRRFRMWFYGIMALVVLVLSAYSIHIHDVWEGVFLDLLAGLNIIIANTNRVRMRTARRNF